jgi:sulfur carrier protein
MTITLNGEERQTPSRTIAELLQEVQAPEAGIAVARNAQVVRRAEHQSTLLREGDAIEIIRAVQGG